MSNIQNTTQYSKFNSFVSNRKVYEMHVRSLMEDPSFPEGIKNSPIVVNKDLYVIDGQHRLEACLRLKIPVYFVIDKNATELDLVSRNTNLKPWNGNDYVNFYADKSESYKSIKYVLETYKTTISFITSALVGLGCSSKIGMSKKIKKGEINIEGFESDLNEFTKIYKSCIKQVDILKDRAARPYATEHYIRAMAYLFKNDIRTFKKVTEKMMVCSFTAPYVGDYRDALKFLEKVSRWSASKNGVSN